MAWLLTDADFNILLAAEIDASMVVLSKVGTPTYTDLEDYVNTTGDSGLLSGATITDDGDGTITIAACTGLIYTTDSPVGSLVFFDLAQDTTVTLTDESLNYIYAEYNGGTPRYQATTDLTSISGTHQFVTGIVWKSGTDLHIANVGKHLDKFQQQVYEHQFYHDGLERANGCVLTDAGSLAVNLSAGNLSWALHLLPISAATPASFKLFYYDGSWQEGSLISAFPNTQYNDYGVGLENLTPQRYGVYWMYLMTDGDLYGVYGVGDYTLAAAELAVPPANLPPELTSVGTLVAKIIFQASGAEIIEIEYPWTTTFVGSAASDHGSLAGLTDNDHTQYILHSLATAANDFLVASGSGTFVKKTLAETGAILEGDLDHGSIQGLSDDDHTQYILADATRAFSGTVIGKLTETIPEIVIDASAPGTTYPGLIWLDTDGVFSVGTSISDADNDTKVEVEQSPDADEVVVTAGGTEALTVKSTGIEVTGTVTIGATALSEANLIDLTDSGETSLHTHPAAAGADSTAIHDNVASEISAITEKTSPVSADMLVIEDSEAANVKKMLKLANLPAGSAFTLTSYVYAYMTAAMSNLSTNTTHALNLTATITDKNSDFDTTNKYFVAPSDGYYMFTCHALYTGVDQVTGIKFNLTTSNKDFQNYEGTNMWDIDGNYWVRTMSMIAWMDASDTAYLTFYQQGGAAQTDINNGSESTNFIVAGPFT